MPEVLPSQSAHPVGQMLTTTRSSVQRSAKPSPSRGWYKRTAASKAVPPSAAAEQA